MCASFDYNNNTNWGTTGTNVIENINNFIPDNNINPEIKRVYEIKEELIDEMDNSKLESIEIDENHINIMNKFSENIKNNLDFYIKQQSKVLDLEVELKKYYDNLDNDINKLKDFTCFLSDINNKYDKNIDTEIINKSILDASINIKENNSGKELKKQYEKEISLLNFYLNNFIKKINNANMGNTCSLCLQRNVDTYMQPCGHTGCSECIKKLKDKMGDYDCNCFICRKRVEKFGVLYFV